MSVHKKLIEARVKLLNTKLTKSGLNKFAGFQYFELGDFLPAITGICNEVGLCGTVSFQADHAALTITDVEDGTSVVFTSPSVEVQMKGCLPIQGLGAAQTYLRRYLWVTAMEIVEHDALDATVGKDEKKPIAPLTGVWDSMDEESKKFLQGIADETIGRFNDISAESAALYLSAQSLDNDEKSAVWSRLDSKLRSAIKKYNEENKVKK
jgi:ERF superfamily